MLLNIIELILAAFEVLFLVLFFVMLKRYGEETIEEVKGKLMFLANAIFIMIILSSVVFVIDAIIDFIK